MYMKIKLFVIVHLMVLFPMLGNAKKIRIAVNESKPYVVFHRDHGTVTRCSGVTVDVLHYLFNENIEYIYCESKQEVIDLVKENKVDVGANVTLTPDRMQGLTYSLPYLETYVGVMTKKISQPTILASFWRGIHNWKFILSLIQVILVIIVLFFITGTVLYFLEYRRDRKGYFLACYTSFVSIAFLAGLEGEPVRKSSKVVLVIITLFYSLTFAPYIIGYITAQIQEQHGSVSDYTNLDQLHSVNVYTAANTSNESVLSESDITYQTGLLEDILPDIKKGKSVYVHDKNILQNYIFENKLEEFVTLSPIVVRKSSRVLIYSPNFKLHREAYDIVLVKMKNIGKADQMAGRYGIAP